METTLKQHSYHVKIVMRDGQGQVADDYHATVTRTSDGEQLIFISRWCWLLEWKTRRSALDRAFARSDKRRAKLSVRESIIEYQVFGPAGGGGRRKNPNSE